MFEPRPLLNHHENGYGSQLNENTKNSNGHQRALIKKSYENAAQEEAIAGCK